jgi:excisionase family DNA binding protein
VSRMPVPTPPTPNLPPEAVDSVAQMLSIPEAAELMGVSQDALRRWVREGLIPARRVGKRMLRVNKSDLARLVTDVSSSA